MYADPTLMDLAAAYAKRRNGRKTKHAVACDRPGAKAKMESPTRVALTPMHTRADQGYENFISNLMKIGGITRDQAQKAFKAFKDAKVLVTKDQYHGGGITVKHGAFMERDVIRRAAGLPEEHARPGAKAKMGLLDRLGAAASALAGPGKDPTTQEYKTSVTEAKKAAIDEVKNYAFMVKQNDQKLAALDAYVKSTSKAIATLNSAPEILRLTEGLRQAVKARSVLLQTLKMPFGRDGEKSSMARMDDATRRELRLFISRYVSNVKPADAERLMTAMYEKDPEHWEDQGFGKLAIAALGRNFSRPGAKAKMGKDVRSLNNHLSDLIRQRDMLVADDRRAGGKDMKVANHLHRIRQEIDVMLREIAKVEKSVSSRPGAKAKMGANEVSTPDAIAKMMEAWNKIEAQAKKQFPNASKEEIYRITKDAMNHALRTKMSRPGAKAKSTHAALPPQTIEAERKPGGGSHSEAVSRKIATLINEGKPQDQAVAIALDLERRGEL